MKDFRPEEHRNGKEDVKLFQLVERGGSEGLHGQEGVGEVYKQLRGKFYSSKQQREEREVTGEGGKNVEPEIKISKYV